MEELLTASTRAATSAATAVDAGGWPAAAWDDLAARSPLGDVYQAYEWGEVKRTLGWGILRYVVVQDGRRLAAFSI
jgi:hypothetical protein